MVTMRISLQFYVIPICIDDESVDNNLRNSRIYHFHFLRNQKLYFVCRCVLFQFFFRSVLRQNSTENVYLIPNGGSNLHLNTFSSTVSAIN